MTELAIDETTTAIHDLARFLATLHTSDYFWELSRAQKLCGSPAEFAFLLALIRSAIYHDTQAGCGVWILDPKGERFDILEGYLFYVQLQAPIGRYRADFLLSADAGGNGKVQQLVVEIDGHDFHDRTKEQASHDRARDRAFLRQGLNVIRFTGSDVYRRAEACATEALDLFWRQPAKAAV